MLFPSVKYSCLRVGASGSANRAPGRRRRALEAVQRGDLLGREVPQRVFRRRTHQTVPLLRGVRHLAHLWVVRERLRGQDAPPHTVFPYPAVKHWLPRLLGVTTSNQRQYLAAAAAGTASEAASGASVATVARRRYAPTASSDIFFNAWKQKIIRVRVARS